RESDDMLRFKNMRQRVEFAYERMNIDIYYEGDYRYTVEHHSDHKIFEKLSEEQVDEVLNQIWQELKVEKVG
ncbi:MAG: hypothetical protein CVU98_07935, partial [Firmicutes bacterium HGW-Firmicutes-3]